MAVNAVPRRLRSVEIPEGYKCPVNGVSSSRDDDVRWVACPLFLGDFISYGSCLDLQGLARSEEFESDPYRDMFEDIAKQRGASLAAVRMQCLCHHQIYC